MWKNMKSNVKIHRPKGFDKNSRNMDSVNLHLITWNVATRFPEAGLNLGSLLQNSSPDLVLFGLQEVKSQPQNILADALLEGEDPWTSSLRSSLAPLGYVKVKTIRLLGTVVSLFSLVKHIPHIRGLETQFTRLGLGGYWGNKGCVSVRWSMYGVSIVVLCSHLAAHSHMNHERIASYNTILGSHKYSHKQTELILYHDYVFWMGDLNFRLESEADKNNYLPEAETIIKSVARMEYSKLLAMDQLVTARSNGEAFGELRETLPSFPPSYKFRIGTSEYDTKRAPAWTDRILFKANEANYDMYELSVRQHGYTALQEFTQSDHKPVISNLTVTVFSPSIATDLLLPVFNPIVRFVDAGPYFAGEDLLLIYTVTIDERRFLSTWDWIGLYREDCSNLEDYVTYTWASTKMVRDGAYEVMFGEAVTLRPGNFRFVYFSSGGRDIYAYSDVVTIRSGTMPQRSISDAFEATEDTHIH